MRNIVTGYRLMLGALGSYIFNNVSFLSYIQILTHSACTWLSGGPLLCKILATPKRLYLL